MDSKSVQWMTMVEVKKQTSEMSVVLQGSDTELNEARWVEGFLVPALDTWWVHGKNGGSGSWSRAPGGKKNEESSPEMDQEKIGANIRSPATVKAVRPGLQGGLMFHI